MCKNDLFFLNMKIYSLSQASNTNIIDHLLPLYEEEDTFLRKWALLCRLQVEFASENRDKCVKLIQITSEKTLINLKWFKKLTEVFLRVVLTFLPKYLAIFLRGGGGWNDF